MSSPTSPRNLSASDKALQLRSLPDGATRVQVRDAKGKNCWRKVDEVATSDVLMFGTDGKPVVMRGEPGRKPKINLEPLDEGTKEVIAAKNEHIKDDPLLAAVSSDPAADAVLDLVMRELTIEAASLGFERAEAERHNVDTSALSVKRARILATVGEMLLKRRDKLADAAFDIDTPGAEAFIEFLLETIRDEMVTTGVRPEAIEAIYGRLGKILDDGWKAEAKSKMRDAASKSRESKK